MMHTAPGSEVGTLENNGTICRLGAEFSESCHDWCLEPGKRQQWTGCSQRLCGHMGLVGRCQPDAPIVKRQALCQRGHAWQLALEVQVERRIRPGSSKRCVWFVKYEAAQVAEVATLTHLHIPLHLCLNLHHHHCRLLPQVRRLQQMLRTVSGWSRRPCVCGAVLQWCCCVPTASGCCCNLQRSSLAPGLCQALLQVPVLPAGVRPCSVQRRRWCDAMLVLLQWLHLLHLLRHFQLRGPGCVPLQTTLQLPLGHCETSCCCTKLVEVTEKIDSAVALVCGG